MSDFPTLHRPAADVALAHLAADEAELRDRVAELERDIITYRSIALEAIHALHDVTMERDRLRARYHALLAERRALRAPRAA